MDNSVATVNAAAAAILEDTAESRVQQVSSPHRRRWKSGWLRMYWCFRQPFKRINHAVVSPESTNLAEIPQNTTATASTATDNPSSSTHTLLPFVAPPSSPASFLHTEPPSAVDSPVELFSVTSSISYPYPGSISRPSSSIFVIGPYAHETQVVSPPAFTTEPSTAPFTPPPESGGVNQPLTTPPSPEVPFAKLLMSSWESSNMKKGEYGSEFHTYQLYPGSPVGTLISPNSIRSGTSSPLPDLEFHSSSFSPFPIASDTPPKHGRSSEYSRYSFQLTGEELEGEFLEKNLWQWWKIEVAMDRRRSLFRQKSLNLIMLMERLRKRVLGRIGGPDLAIKYNKGKSPPLGPSFESITEYMQNRRIG